MRRTIMGMLMTALAIAPLFAMGGRPPAPQPDESSAVAQNELLPGVPSEEAACEETKTGAKKRAEPEMQFQAESFVVPLDWEGDGFITGEKDKKLLISAGDTVYINIGSSKVKQGTNCMVYRLVGKVRDHETRKVIGYEVRRIAKLVLTSGIGENTSTAKVTVSYEPVEIGDTVKIVSKENEKDNK